MIDLSQKIPEKVVDLFNKEVENLKLKDATTVGNEEVHSKIRKSKVRFIQGTNWFLQIVYGKVLVYNRLVTNFDLEGWDSGSCQYTVYDEKGSHYKWHIDLIRDNFKEPYCRKVSIVVALNDWGKDYTGGELLIWGFNAGVETYKLKKGECVIFPSILLHKVKPVKSGIRKTLVGWASGPTFK